MDALIDRTIIGHGTSEQRWASWFQTHPLPTGAVDDLVAAGQRVVFVAPHPDDEVLCGGGLLHQLARRGHDILLIAVTDGEASHPGSSLWPPQALARERRSETRRALSILAPQAHIDALQIPDGAITHHETALQSMLHSRLRSDDVVFTTWRMDGHPDHEATGRATANAAAVCGCNCHQLPLWAWHWAEPSWQYSLPWQRAVAITLSDEDLALKRRAVECFSTQLQTDATTGSPPILGAHVLSRLLRPFEVVLR